MTSKRAPSGILHSAHQAASMAAPLSSSEKSSLKNYFSQFLSPKFARIYNAKGRIGIYNRSERDLILAKYRKKKARRVWTKKIRYGCRKSLADRRLRIKGRFVKKDSEEAKAYYAMLAKQQTDTNGITPNPNPSPTSTSIKAKPITESTQDDQTNELKPKVRTSGRVISRKKPKVKTKRKVKVKTKRN